MFIDQGQFCRCAAPAQPPGESHEDIESGRTTDLKGHGFSRADFEVQVGRL
jgi:hypothetical protein